MGRYIQVPANTNKAQQLVEIYQGKIVGKPESLSDIPTDQALFCVVQNGMFDAAAYIYDEGELKEFSKSDGRPRTWVLLDKQLAEELAQ